MAELLRRTYVTPRRAVFTGWSGYTASNNQTITVLVDSPKSLRANWRAEYGLEVVVGV